MIMENVDKKKLLEYLKLDGNENTAGMNSLIRKIEMGHFDSSTEDQKVFDRIEECHSGQSIVHFKDGTGLKFVVEEELGDEEYYHTLWCYDYKPKSDSAEKEWWE